MERKTYFSVLVRFFVPPMYRVVVIYCERLQLGSRHCGEKNGIRMGWRRCPILCGIEGEDWGFVAILQPLLSPSRLQVFVSSPECLRWWTVIRDRLRDWDRSTVCVLLFVCINRTGIVLYILGLFYLSGIRLVRSFLYESELLTSTWICSHYRIVIRFHEQLQRVQRVLRGRGGWNWDTQSSVSFIHLL